MYERLDKLRDDVKRAEKRKQDAEIKLRTAQAKLKEAENSQILSDVGALNLTPEQVAQFLQLAASGKLPKISVDGTFGTTKADGSESVDSESEENPGYHSGYSTSNAVRTTNGYGKESDGEEADDYNGDQEDEDNE